MSYSTYKPGEDTEYVRVRMTKVWATFKSSDSRYVVLRKGMEIPTYPGERVWKTASGNYSAELQYSDQYPGKLIRITGIPSDALEEF